MAGPEDDRDGCGRVTLLVEELPMITSRDRGNEFPEPPRSHPGPAPAPSRTRLDDGGRLPSLVVAAMCALMMAVMMRGMGQDPGRR